MFGQTEDSRSLDLFNASRVEAHKPVSEAQAREARQAHRYSDAWLDEAEAGQYGRGDQNAAPYLRQLATQVQRRRAVAEAWTLNNVVGGRFSSNVYAAVREMLRNIEAGNESKELYGEHFARVAREREADLRRTTGNPNAIHNPFLR